MGKALVSISFVALMAFALWAVGSLLVLSNEVPVEVIPYIVDELNVDPGNHGIERHGAEYVQAVQTCQGTTRRSWFLEPDKRTLHVLCEGTDGWYDLVLVMQDQARTLFEKTAFKRASTWQEAVNAMLRKGATPITKATIKRIIGVP